MIISQISVMVQFGSADVAVGTTEFEGGGYSLNCRNMNEAKAIGDKIERSDVEQYSDLVVLWFPTLEQALRVKAAMVNKTYEECLEAWLETKAKKEAEGMVWTERIKAEDL